MLIPALSQEHVRSNDVLLQLHPSLPNLRKKSPSLVRPVHRYYGAVRLLQHVHVRRTASGLHGPAFAYSEGVLEISRFSCMLFSWRARALRLRRTGQPLANDAAAVLPSSYSEGSRHPVLPAFRSSITPPTNASVYASSDTSRSHPQDSRSGCIRYFLSCRDLHHYNMPV